MIKINVDNSNFPILKIACCVLYLESIFISFAKQYQQYGKDENYVNMLNIDKSPAV